MRPITIRKHVAGEYGPQWRVCYHGQLVGQYRTGAKALAFVHGELKAKPKTFDVTSGRSGRGIGALIGKAIKDAGEKQRAIGGAQHEPGSPAAG